MSSESGSTRIRPLQDRIIVERIESEEKTASGLYIPDSAKEKPQQGKVLAVGKGKIKEDGSVQPVDLRVGDTILFGKYSGQEIKIDGTDYLIMREDDVLGVLQ
jgi:chaperonin GroES